VFSVDINKSQNFLFELKILALKSFSFDDYCKFIGIQDFNNRIDYYNQIKQKLSLDAKSFWDNSLKSIKIGIINCGKFDTYVKIFSKYLLKFIQSKKTIDTLLSIDNKEFQSDFYDKKWNNWRWRFIFKIFFSDFVMKRKGRSKQMFQFAEKNKSENYFFKRCEKFFKSGNIQNNNYLEFLLKGNYYKNLPFYLKNNNFEKLKKYDSIEIVNSGILELLNKLDSNSVSKFNLSNIFEPLDLELTNLIFEEILRVAKPNSKIIFWNNLVKRDVPDYLKQNFIFENNQTETLKLEDKVFFYEKFNIYTIQK